MFIVVWFIIDQHSKSSSTGEWINDCGICRSSWWSCGWDYLLSLQGAWVQSLVGEQRSHILRSVTKRKKKPKGLPWCLSDKESACQSRRHNFDPWLRRFHMPLTLRSRDQELQRLSPCAATAEARAPWSPCSTTREATALRSPCTATRE